MSSKPTIGAVRRIAAVALGVVTILCTLLWLLTFALITAQSIAGVYESPMFGAAIFMITFPPALLSTVIALFLVGPRRCKLAWISFCIYVAPFTISLQAIVVYALWDSIKSHFSH